MSDSIPKAGNGTQASRCRPWTVWRCFRWTCRILVLFVIGVFAASFFARGWLTDRAMDYVEERLHARGIFFKHGPVVYEMDRGLVVEDLVLFETEAKRRPYLRVSNIGMDFGLSSLLLGEDLDVKSIDLSVNRGVLKLYDGEQVAELRRLQFFGKSTPQWIQILSAEGLINGVEIRATGDIRTEKREPAFGKGGKSGEPKPKPRKIPNFAWLRKVGNLVVFESDRKPPVLKLDVNLDKRDGAEEPLRVAAEVRGVNTRWKGLPLDEIDGEFVVTWSDKKVDITRARVVYQDKAIEGKLRYDVVPRMLEIERLVSEANLVDLLGESPINLGEKVEMVRMIEPPRLFFSGRVPFGDFFSSSILADCEREGTVVIGRGDRPLTVNLLSGGVRYASGALNSEALAIGLFGGQANIAGAVNLVETPTVYEGGASFSEMPLSTVLKHFGKEGDWPGVISGSFAGMGGFAIGSLEGTGEITLAAEELSVSGPFSLTKAVAATDGLNIEYGGGVAAVAGRVDTAASPMNFECAVNMESMPVQSLLDLVGIEKEMSGMLTTQFRASGENTLESIAGKGEIKLISENYEVVGPLSLERRVVSTEGLAARYGGGVAVANGKVDTGVSPLVFEGDLELESMPIQSLLNLAKVEKEMTGVLSGRFEGTGSKALESIRGTGTLQFVDEAYQVEGPYVISAGIVGSEGLAVKLGGGRIGVQGKVDLLATPKTYDGSVRVEAVPIQSLLDLTGADREVEGNVFGGFSGSGSAMDLASLNGSGDIRIQDGKLYSVPLIGQMKSFLGGILPTFEKVQKSDLEATFTIAGGILNTKDLVAASDMTRVEIDGDLNLAEKTASFSALAKVEGVVGVATNVVSRLLELEADGPVDDLDIRLKNNPAEMAAGAVKGTVGMAKDGVSGLTKRAKNVGGGAVRAGTKGVKKVGKVGKGIGKLILGKKKEPEEKAPNPEPLRPSLPAPTPVPPVEPAPMPVPVPQS